jgi:hypothetical protein
VLWGSPCGHLRNGGGTPNALDLVHDQADEGDFNMQRLALSLALMGAALLACGAATALPSRAMAFELDTGAATVPGGTAQFYDPDEAPLPAPLPSARLEEDGTNLQMAPGTGTSLQIAPGTSLQIAPIGGAAPTRQTTGL